MPRGKLLACTDGEDAEELPPCAQRICGERAQTRSAGRGGGYGGESRDPIRCQWMLVGGEMDAGGARGRDLFDKRVRSDGQTLRGGAESHFKRGGRARLGLRECARPQRREKLQPAHTTLLAGPGNRVGNPDLRGGGGERGGQRLRDGA